MLILAIFLHKIKQLFVIAGYLNFKYNFKIKFSHGYIGQYCDQCEVNFWGNPREIGGSCEKCHCHDNIDFNVIKLIKLEIN